MDKGKHYGKRIKLARLKAGWTQSELAFRAECQRQELSAWERGIHSPRVSTFYRILEICKASTPQTTDEHETDKRAARKLWVEYWDSLNEVEKIHDERDLEIFTEWVFIYHETKAGLIELAWAYGMELLDEAATQRRAAGQHHSRRHRRRRRIQDNEMDRLANLGPHDNCDPDDDRDYRSDASHSDELQPDRLLPPPT
jgi:transcriptional regulator with XRE-family HTH domain